MSYHPDDGVFTDIIRIKQSKILSYLNVLKALISGKPLQIAYYKNRHYKNKLKHIIDDYDATLSHLIRVGDYVKDMSGIHILEMTDAISMNYERVRQTAPSVSLKVFFILLNINVCLIMKRKSPKVRAYFYYI